MASLARYSARLVARRVPDAGARGFRTTTRCLAAQNFTMPALSPTMTEGNIAKWSVKEGDSFAAGDVLLEIETDKATMDVEAQEDGVLVKIMQADGAKAVSVGTRIAVIAEPGDDLAALEIPPDESPAAAQKATPAAADAARSEPTKTEEAKKPAAPKASDGKTYTQKYPLLPSVAQLIAEKGLDDAAVAKITPTGPNGRLLKGDVLAHLGAISAERPAAVSDMFQRLSHLDLSNIKVAERKAAAAAAPPAAAKAEAPAPAAPKKLEVAVPVSLGKVIEVQKKIQATLGVFMPVSTFIARAAEVANDDLPPSAAPPTTDELFNQILGLDKIVPAKLSRGRYVPQVAALPPSSMLARPAAPKKQDIIDILTGSGKPTRRPAPTAVPGLTAGNNVFSLTVPKAETQRATVFLERVKVMLETEPGRLVL